MFEDYLKAILADCEKKRTDKTLSQNLSNPTPGDFRNECITVFRERPLSNDDEALRLFFGAADKEIGFARNIENSKAVQYKQMPKILKGDISSPNRKYIELLAWLVDFNQRPFTKYISQFDPPDIPKPPMPPKPPIGNAIIVSIGVVLVAGTFFFWKDKTPSMFNDLVSTQKCMYWKDDHYESIDCNVKITDAPVIPLNIRKLNYFKKITLPDTLTKNSLGKVWYIRTGNYREYFTDSGSHPIDTVRKLRPLSAYILFKYISYYRYLLTLLLWSICLVIFIALCTISLIAFWKKRKRENADFNQSKNAGLVATSPFSTKSKNR